MSLSLSRDKKRKIPTLSLSLTTVYIIYIDYIARP
uniref:Uncharacterized protein n=1 Tax=Siphoviridae sp. ctnNB1 TaxID=2825660 RepID=A0A8S5UV72_9CAUD|nr:MAG TPA: hypothetical protein [Siphoviridae sp. ctnNB1]